MPFNMAEADEQERKLFVGGLNKITDDDNLRGYFGKYGEIVDCSIMRDPEKKSRGFGFILFDDSTSVDKIIAAKKDGTTFSVDERTIEIKRALPKVPRGTIGAPRAERLNKKIFVGGLPNTITEEDVKMYFEAFGQVNEVQLIKDRETGRLRGFAFITFDDEDSADKCLQRRTHEIGKKMCEVKRAQTRSREQALAEKKEPVASQAQEATSAALPMTDVNRLIQQAFAMGQGAIQPPSTNQPNTSILLQALLGQQPAPQPPVAPPPIQSSTTSTITQLAQLLQAGGIDTNTLGSLLKEPGQSVQPTSSLDLYSSQPNYSQTSSYTSKEEYTPAAKRAYRPY